MAPNAKRDTVLPNTLWQTEKRNVDNGEIGSHAGPVKKLPEKNHSHRFGVPIMASEKNGTLAYSKKNSIENYHRSYNIDQAGPGVIALKDTENLPICLIKERKARNPRSLRGLQFASHKNLIALVDNFQSRETLHLVYEYDHMAISLGCVAGAVQFSEADIATLCREVLDGLKYIHLGLKSSYGLLNFSNILLTWQGEAKLANIGDCLLDKKSLDMVPDDIKDVGSIVVSLNDRTAALCESSQEVNMSLLSEMAHSFVQRTRIETLVERLMKDEFLTLANPGGAWSLKRHYFETLPMGIRVGSRVSKAEDME